ncbi:MULTISPECIES: hypothetical protein [Streptomyces]|uniref:hypothetical protein n=1 Tax=Streptomyces TaxID=1883 RepID=UPI001E5E69D5|nr:MULTISPECIES: hypothetical protein [Streptomyces]UFQ16451.1 hypothetical protein J2N69_16360 [Streptomyces huasconensis]WCL86053.1 hypothetical protein PPN52_16370 [Streptomyces sp. JCM 35825]
MQTNTLESLYADILSSGGMTYRPGTPAPVAGYMVSVAGAERMLPVARFTPTALEQYMSDYRARMKTTDALYYGAWIDGDYVYLDVSVNVQGRAEAEAMGRLESQLAIYDVTNAEVISL